MVNLKDYRNRLAGRVAGLRDRSPDELGRLGRMAVYQLRLWPLCWQRVLQDRLITVAGHLTFKTLLGLIPVLVLFLLIVNFFWREGDAGNQLQDAVFRALSITEIRIEVDGEDVDLAQKINSIVSAAQANMNAAAAVGIAVLFYLAMSVLATIEGAMNRIWQVRQSRPLWKRLILFWLVLTLGPPAAAAAYYASGYVQGYIGTGASLLPEWLQVLWGGAIALAANCFVLFILYKLLPNVAVRTRAALAGAVVAGVLWHLMAKTAFEIYIGQATGYSRMYGNLAVVPLFFLWLYVTWLFVLFGFEVAYVVQNFKGLLQADVLSRDRDRFLAADFLGLMAMAVVARRFREGQGPTPLATLVEAAGIGQADLEDLLGRLESAGLLARTPQSAAADDAACAYLPAREPHAMTAAEITQAVHGVLPVPIDSAHLALHKQVRAAYERLRSDRSLAAGGVTVADLAAVPASATP